MRRLWVQFPSSAPVAGWQVRLLKNSLTFEPVTVLIGQLAKWPKAADCKSAGVPLRRFESFTAHWPEMAAKKFPPGMAGERQALIAQLVERALGKGKVMGSNPIEGSLRRNTRNCPGYLLEGD